MQAATVLLIVLMAVLTDFAKADPCQVNAVASERVAGRSFSIEMASGMQIWVIGQAYIGNEGLKTVVHFFTRRDLPAEELTSQIKLFLYQSDPLKVEMANTVEFLKQFLQNATKPSFVIADTSPADLIEWEKDAQILRVNQFAQNHFAVAANIDWDSLLMLAVGPAVFLKTKSPELFATHALVAANELPANLIPAMPPEQKAPTWLELSKDPLATNNEPASQPIPELNRALSGDGVILVRKAELPLVSAHMEQICLQSNKAAAKADEVPVAAQQADSPPAALPARAPPPPHKNHGAPQVVVGATAEQARQAALAKHAPLYTWMTRDKAGHTYKHTRVTR